MNSRQKFKELFEPLESKIKLIMNSGSALSGFTLAIAAFIVCMHITAEYHTALRLVPSLLVAVVVGFIVEGSIRLFTPVLQKQLVRWDFYNRYFIGMFAIITLLLFGCYTVSGVFSVIGSRHLVSIVSKVPTGADISEAAAPFDKHLQEERAGYKEQKKAINKAANDQIKAIEKEYNQKIRDKRKQAKNLKAEGKPGHNWLVSSVIPGLQNKMNRKVQAVNDQKAAQIAALNESHQKAVAGISEQKGLIVQQTVKENNRQAETAINRIEKAGNGLAILTVLGLACFFFCSLILVIIKVGGKKGIEKESAPAPKIIPVSATETRPRNVKPVSETLNSSESFKVQVEGFSGEFDLEACRKKIQQYNWKLDNGKGKTETNNRNIQKFEDAIKRIKEKRH